MYPTSDFFHSFHKNTPILFTLITLCTLLFVIGVFYLYDTFVERRNRKLILSAAHTNAIVSSMFPGHLRERVMAQNEDKVLGRGKHGHQSKSSILRSLLEGGDDRDLNEDHREEAIADLFLQTTVTYMDIVGFTAWSSTREPSHVFSLLESLFRAFDKHAKKRHVFKVETVGDCYVAVAGLPHPVKNHAVCICRFARDCVRAMRHTTKVLETSLGPDTGDLNIRIGIHSGPVTAGVLRGDRSRFQLFGETLETTAKMEHNGRPGRIHVSEETAALLKADGRDHWFQQRGDVVHADGKGQVKTYWLSIFDDREGVPTSFHQNEKWEVNVLQKDARAEVQTKKRARLIDWNVQIMSRILKQIM